MFFDEYLDRLTEQQADDAYTPDTEFDISNEVEIRAEIFDAIDDVNMQEWKNKIGA